MTTGADQKQNISEATASAAHMAGILHALNAVHSFCVMHKGAWILDSGASEHMSSERQALRDLTLLKFPVLVTFPNGTRVKVTYKEKLQIAKGLTLQDVLLVPNFKFNLLSIQKLCKQLKCTVEFTETLCMLQAPSLKKPLAIGTDCMGLYVLDREVIQDMELLDKERGLASLDEAETTSNKHNGVCISAASSINIDI